MLIVQLRSAQPDLDPRVGRFSMAFKSAGWTPVIAYWRRGEGEYQPEGYRAVSALTTPRSLMKPPFALIPFLLSLFYLRSLALVIRLHPKVCVAHQLDTLPFALTLRRLMPGMKVVFDTEDVYSLMVYPDLPPMLRPIVYAIERILSSKADLSVHPNEATRDYADQDDDSSVVVPNVPEKGFDSPRHLLSKESLGMTGEFSVLYFGSLSPHMGLETLIQAVKLLASNNDHVDCVIAGDGPLLERLRKDVQDAKIEKKVHFLGRVARSIIPDILSASDVSIILYTQTSPIMWMATPNKLFESMSLGVPVIASNFGMLAKIVSETHCGLLADPTNPDNVADMIRRLSSDVALRRSLSRNALEAMRTKFSSERVEQSLVEALRQLVADR